MSVLIRPFENRDLQAVVAAQHLAVPLHPWSVGELERDLVRLEPHVQHHLMVAEDAGNVVGASDFYRPYSSYHPHKFFLQLFVVPEHQNQGIGRVLYAHTLEKILSLKPISLGVQVRENQALALHFAQSRGFGEIKRDFESVLDLTEFNEQKFAHLETNLKRQGIELQNLDELDSPAFRRHFHEVFSEVRLDVPRAEPASPIAFDFFQTNVLEEPEILRACFVFAMRNQNMLGFTGAYSGAAPGWADQWLTAVRREARGNHVATAVKVKSLQNAKALGVRTVRTDNDSRNTAMLAVNTALGYARQPAVLSLRKTFEDA